MVWKFNGETKKSPSSFKLNIDDIDIDSYRSTSNASLIDKTLAKGMVKCSFSWDYLTEEEAEELMALTWINPMPLEIKCPILGGKTLKANFRCAKRSVDMISTDEEEQSAQTRWKVSFTCSQKEKVSGQ